MLDNVPVAVDDESSATPYGHGVFIANLDWCSPDRIRLLQRAEADIIIACDTIYLPELHDALGTVVLEGMKQSNYYKSDSSPTTREDGIVYPCTFFSQMRRNPETFAHYIETFAQLGMTVDSVTQEANALPSRFAYDREAIEFHRFTTTQ